MPVNTRHRQVTEMVESWSKVRDCVVGPRAVRAARGKYLPQLKGQSVKDYEAYQNRALFVDATRRTHDGLVGMVFRKDPVPTVPESFKPRLNDITLSGVPFDAWAKSVFGQVLAPGRCGILVTALPAAPDASSEPYATWYAAENIVNWTVVQKQLVRVVLFEQVEEPDPTDHFVPKLVDQYRSVELINGALFHQLYRKSTAPNAKKEEWLPFGNPEPATRRGEPLDFVPFIFLNPTSIEPDVEEPPLLGLAEINLSLYRTSADLENGRHFTGLPQPYVFGIDGTGAKEFHIGSTKAWTSSNADAKAGYMEVQSEFGALTKAVEEKTGQMVVQGARLLELQKRAAEAADTLRLRKSGEESPLISMAHSVGHGLSKTLAYLVWWSEGTGDLAAVEDAVGCKLNTEFEEIIMASDDAFKLMQTWQGHGVSQPTLLYNYERGGLFPPDITAEDEQKLIRAEMDKEMENETARLELLNPQPIVDPASPPKPAAKPASNAVAA